MNRRLFRIFVTLGFFILLLSIAVGVITAIRYFIEQGQDRQISQITPQAEQVTKEIIIATLPPPLMNVEFPSEVINYPPDWPDELRYPSQFSVVETTSGILPGSENVGWAAKLLYQGDPTSAEVIMSDFLLTMGWQIVDRTELDTGGFLILIEKNHKENTGVVVIDSDVTNPGVTKILATIFP